MISLLVGSLMVFGITFIQAELVTAEKASKAQLQKDIQECINTTTATPDIDKIKLAVIFCRLGYKAMDSKLYKLATEYFNKSLYLAPGYTKSVKGFKLLDRMQGIDNSEVAMKKLDTKTLSWTE